MLGRAFGLSQPTQIAFVGWGKRSAAQRPGFAAERRPYSAGLRSPKPETAISTAPTTIAESAMLKAGQWCTS